MLSREDMLRALELLPVWQLRQPAQPDGLAGDAQSANEADAVLPNVEEAKQQALQCRLLVSVDTQWLFLLPAVQSADAEALFKNMLKAVSVEVGQDVKSANATQLGEHAPKVIVVMGDAQAQQLLGESFELDAWRGKAHQYEQVPVIATYTPHHLLANPQDKAKAWEDLCLAKFTIASL